ncbi:putative ATP-grasp-modified RiPP [Streptomyces sp. NPDC049906]|uniref:putative ATP-grasp-modified RiPP n=1 Tax=Streptomyces sp. NPDC049906 TaxID=3155656 RepID=UPI003440B999
MSKLAPPAFPSQVQRTAIADRSAGTVRPFGLTTALPIRNAEGDADTTTPLSLCPTRQITVTEDGQPFIHAPSMKTAFTSQTQTREDMQLATDTENDTD